MKHKLKFVFCLIFVLTAGNFIVPGIGCASEPLIIGMLHWEEYPYAEMMRNSYQMALELINKEGGIKGRPLKLVYGDDQGEREPGEKVVRELAKKGAVMLTGGYASSNTIYTARIANKLDIPFLICTAADDRITHRKWENVFRLNPPASEYTKGLEDFFLKEIRPKTMAIVYENSPYGTGSALRMMWFCREHDIEIRKIIPYHKERAGSAYFQRILAPLKEEPPDVIYMVSYLKDGVALVKKIREMKINALLCGGAGGFTHQKFVTMAGESADNLVTVSLWHHQSKYPRAKAYYNQHVEKYSETPDYHGAEAYSALLVAADALRRAESYDSANIRATLNQTDMKTPFGPVKFSNYRKFERQNSFPTLVLQIIQNKFECIWPKDLVTSKFVSPSDWRRSD
ncbi:ABC transporter substrate-binding protein [Desulfobacterales bacterium HSG2]|nr:ABC transporter substrate-binding protein [Desulfobacterales bacterium HSG2]